MNCSFVPHAEGGIVRPGLYARKRIRGPDEKIDLLDLDLQSWASKDRLPVIRSVEFAQHNEYETQMVLVHPL